MTPDCKVDPKNTFYFDIREYPKFKKRWEDWFSTKVITKKGFVSSFWRNRENFGNASTSIMNIIIHDELMFRFTLERQNYEEMHQGDAISPVYMPISFGEVKEKILKNTNLYNTVLTFASEVQEIIKKEKYTPKQRKEQNTLKPLKRLF